MLKRATFFSSYSEYFGPLFNNLNMELGEYGYFRGDPSWNVLEPPNYYNRLYFIVDGYGLVKQGEKVTELLPGNIYLLPSQNPYHLICPERLEKFYIHFNINLYHVQDIFLFAGNKILQLPWTSKMEPPFSKMEEISNIYDLLPYHNFIYNTIFDFLKFIPEQKLNQFFEYGLKYQEIFSYIHQNLRISLTVKEIAFKTNQSEYTLTKKFKQDLGFSLNQHIQKKLLDFAISQLDSSKSITEIANSLDFCDTHYFSNWFKKKTGYTPSQYRIHTQKLHDLYFYRNQKPFRNPGLSYVKI